MEDQEKVVEKAVKGGLVVLRRTLSGFKALKDE